MLKKLLCLSVQKRNDIVFKGHYLAPTIPSLCGVFVTDELLNSIEKAKHLINTHHLKEVVFDWQHTNWFDSLNEKYYQPIVSNLHITNNYLYFSGYFKHFEKANFVSQPLEIGLLKDQTNIPQTFLNTSLLNSDRAKIIIKDIENLEQELNIELERLDSLSNLAEAINKVQPASIRNDSYKTDKLLNEALDEITKLQLDVEQLELKIENKCKLLCKSILGIEQDDHIFVRSDNLNIAQEIKLKFARYYDNSLHLEGPKRLKNGELSKRNNVISIPLRQ